MSSPCTCVLALQLLRRVQFVSSPKTATPRTARKSVACLIMLKHTLETLPSLASALSSVRNPLLVAIRDNLTAQVR